MTRNRIRSVRQPKRKRRAVDDDDDAPLQLVGAREAVRDGRDGFAVVLRRPDRCGDPRKLVWV